MKHHSVETPRHHVVFTWVKRCLESGTLLEVFWQLVHNFSIETTECHVKCWYLNVKRLECLHDREVSPINVDKYQRVTTFWNLFVHIPQRTYTHLLEFLQ